jgi:hypothetical protein
MTSVLDRESSRSRKRSTTLVAALSVCAYAFPRSAHAQSTRLAPIEIFGDEPGPDDPSRTPRDPGLRVRGGIQFASGGIASNFQYNGTGGGGGIGFHLGLQANNLVGVYLSARFDTLLYFGYGEGDAIVDFTLRDRVQIGIGLGAFGVYNVFSGGGGGVVFPFHFGVTPALWRFRDGSRTGLHIAIDLAPGIGFGGPYYYSSSAPPAFSANLAIGWEWF